ncbi:MAG: ParB/RepB/Spo0J family partition protein [Myxococcales bacterium]|nr:ParB/RepB/Spo0J family partition protein [Myxococcales bacterium]
MAKRKALGRGLSALIPVPGESAGAQIASAPGARRERDYFVCPIEQIKPQRGQPRKRFDGVAIDELARSLSEHGVVQPLLVRPAQKRGEYVLVAGERRWRAAQKAGLREVPVIIRTIDEAEAFEMALVENIQREDLDPLEEAEAYQRLVDEHGYTQEALAERVGKDRSTVANSMRLLKLPEGARRALADGRISSGHARALLVLDGAPGKGRLMQKALAQIDKKALSVRQAEVLVKRLKLEAEGGAAAAAGSAGAGGEAQQSANIRDLQERLVRSLKTRVTLQHRKGNKGRIEIHYNSLDELDRLLEMLLR